MEREEGAEVEEEVRGEEAEEGGGRGVGVGRWED